MKYFFILLFSTLSILGLHAQKEKEPPLKRFADMDTLDYSIARCLYRQLVMKDTLNPQKLTEDIMILQIGKNISRYSDFLTFQSDSLRRADYKINPDIDFASMENRGRYFNWGNDRLVLYKNYPMNKNTSINKIYIDSYQFEESIILPQWQIGKEKKTILGYPCIKATCRYYGRNYEAWFTMELPILNGPWKLTGLPGLILEASDDKKQYLFECIQIQNITWQDPVCINRSESVMKTTTQMYQKMFKQYCDNPQGVISNQTKVQTSESARSTKKKSYNPIELSEEP